MAVRLPHRPSPTRHRRPQGRRSVERGDGLWESNPRRAAPLQLVLHAAAAWRVSGVHVS